MYGTQEFKQVAAHLKYNIPKNIIDSPLCACNSVDVENAYHFFFICQLYNDLMVDLHQSITQYSNMTPDLLLCCDEILSTNTIIITASKFKHN